MAVYYFASKISAMACGTRCAESVLQKARGQRDRDKQQTNSKTQISHSSDYFGNSCGLTTTTTTDKQPSTEAAPSASDSVCQRLPLQQMDASYLKSASNDCIYNNDDGLVDFGNPLLLPTTTQTTTTTGRFNHHQPIAVRNFFVTKNLL